MSDINSNPLGLRTDQLGRLPIGEVLHLTGWSLETLRRRIAAGLFPPPLSGGQGRKRCWAYADVYCWACNQPGTKFSRQEIDKYDRSIIIKTVEIINEAGHD